MSWQKIQEWLLRYGPAEILSVIATMVGGLAAWHISGSRLTVSLSATWCGNIAYFGCILLTDVLRTKKKLALSGKRYTTNTFYKNMRALAVEFGIAEVLDSLLARPALTYYIPLLMNNLTAGILLAKFAADTTFYLPAIVSYELSKKKLRKFD